MTKAQLRERLISQRKLLDNAVIRKESGKVFDKVRTISGFGSFRRVLTYIPINNEVDTKAINDYLRGVGAELYLPAFDNTRWVISKWAFHKLVLGQYGTRQPSEIDKLDGKLLDVALVPCVAFSEKGHRLGYGKGVYDRLLWGLDTLRIGLAYNFQKADQIRAQDHDIVMDFIVTGEKVFKII